MALETKIRCVLSGYRNRKEERDNGNGTSFHWQPRLAKIIYLLKNRDFTTVVRICVRELLR